MADEDWMPQFNRTLDAWDGKFIITSPDVDGLLSSTFLCNQTGAKLIGVYTTSHLILFDEHTKADAINAIWVDHDISHPGIICMGQHLVRLEVDDNLPTRHEPNFNPNLIWPVAWKNCFNGRQVSKVDKYPFATIHYLMRGMKVPDPEPHTTAYSLLAHADGTWVTSYDYPFNCNQWREWMFKDWPGVINEQKFNGVLEFISNTMGWKTNTPQRITKVISGKAQPEYPDRILRHSNLDEWMVENGVFSHAITFRNTIRYTTGMEL